MWTSDINVLNLDPLSNRNQKPINLLSPLQIPDMVYAITKAKTEYETMKHDREWLSQATERLKQETELFIQERDRLQQRWSWTKVWSIKISIVRSNAVSRINGIS